VKQAVNYLDGPSNNSLHPVSYKELNRLITKLNTSKSASPDTPPVLHAVGLDATIPRHTGWQADAFMTPLLTP